jgi:RIO kinase 1
VVDGDGAPQTAPRLAQTRPDPARLASYFDQLVQALATMVGEGVAHGDLSAYNILAQGDRLVIIDLPQIVDLAGNLNGFGFLQRDCANICQWFRSRGLDVDADEVFAELMARAF